MPTPGIRALRKACFGATPKPASETDALPRKKQTGQFFITSFLQLRELDLLGSHRFGAYRPPLQQAGSSSSHSSFCEEVFSFVATALCRRAVKRPDTAGRLHRMRWTGQIFWLLASHACAASHLLPAFTSETSRRLAQWEVVSSYSSATAPEFHGISCADPLFQARKELDREVAACASSVKII